MSIDHQAESYQLKLNEAFKGNFVEAVTLIIERLSRQGVFPPDALNFILDSEPINSSFDRTYSVFLRLLDWI